MEALDLGSASVTDLSPLRGMKLRSLNLYRSAVEDLRPLSGTAVTDAEPLADCPTLEELILPTTPVKLDALRQLPTLKMISKGGVGNPPHATKTAAEIWQEYDAQQAAGKK